MNADERKKHLKYAVVPHLTLLLVIFMRVSNDVQGLMTSGAGAASGGAVSAVGATESAVTAFLDDSESIVRNLLRCVENIEAEDRDLRQQLKDQSDLLTRMERRTVSLSNTLRGGAVDRPSLSADHHSPRQVPDDLSQQPGLEHVGILMDDDNPRRQVEQAQETVRRLERLDSQDHMLALKIVSLADLEEYTSQQKVNSFKDTLLWKISDLARRRNDARTGEKISFYSSPFFTSRHGCKMCARIYLNGDGMGKDTHISLFFVVMRGQYDALLRWPFRQKVILILLDQDNIEHVTNAFKPDPNSSSFQKPRRKMNIASGCPLFRPLSDLDKHAYVRDDTMFVKIIVDISDL